MQERKGAADEDNVAVVVTVVAVAEEDEEDDNMSVRTPDAMANDTRARRATERKNITRNEITGDFLNFGKISIQACIHCCCR